MKAYVKLSLTFSDTEIEIYGMVKMFSLGFYSVTVTGLPLLCVWLLWLFEDWFVVYGTVTSDRLYNLSEIRITDTIYQKTRITVSNLPDFGINIYIVLTLHVINKLHVWLNTTIFYMVNDSNDIIMISHQLLFKSLLIAFGR